MPEGQEDFARGIAVICPFARHGNHVFKWITLESGV